MSADIEHSPSPSEPTSTEVQVVKITTQLAQFDRVAAGLAELRKDLKGVVFDVRKPAGMEAAKAARMKIRKPRYEIENLRKGLKAPVLELGRQIDSRAAAITRDLAAIEDPIHEQIQNEEKRVAEEKERAIAAEQKRVADIQSRILMIRNVPASAATAPPSVVRDYIAKLEQLPLDEGYGEFAQQAADAKAASLGSLHQLHAAAVERAAEEERIRTERAELERLRKEKEARDRLEAEQKAADEKAARAKREAEVAEMMASMRAEREANERSAAARQAELDLQAEQLAAQQAELKRQQAALPAPSQRIEVSGGDSEHANRRVGSESISSVAGDTKHQGTHIADFTPALASTIRPSTIDIIEVIVKHFAVKHTVAMEWLREAAEELAE